jgi:glycogen(starch) synthase
LAERVEFTGWVAPDLVPAFINTAAAVLMPSRREGLPLVSIQAAQMARPVVAARVGGLPEIVVDGETGIVVAPEDSAALADAIEFLIEHPERAVKMGQAARRRAESYFGWTRYLDDTEALYQRLVGQNRGAVSAGG